MKEFESIGISGYIPDNTIKYLYQDYTSLIVYLLEPKIPSSEYGDVINMVDKIDNFPYDKFRRILEGDTSDRTRWVPMLFALYLVDKTKYKNSIDRIVKKYNPENADDFYNLGEMSYTIDEKAGFDTGDGLAQNIQANPVSDNKPKESATGLVFDTVPAPIKINKFGIWCEEIDTFLTDVENLHERKDGRVWLFAGKETSQNPFTEVIKAVYLGEDKDVDVGWQNDKDKVQENISRLRERNNAQEIGDIIFWHLLALAVDDDLWRNNIANVTDWAYCLGFDTQMLQDWCQMVRYVLEGNKLGAYCRYVVKTEQGKKYFHIDCAA